MEFKTSCKVTFMPKGMTIGKAYELGLINNHSNLLIDEDYIHREYIRVGDVTPYNKGVNVENANWDMNDERILLAIVEDSGISENDFFKMIKELNKINHV